MVITMIKMFMICSMVVIVFALIICLIEYVLLAWSNKKLNEEEIEIESKQDFNSPEYKWMKEKIIEAIMKESILTIEENNSQEGEKK